MVGSRALEGQSHPPACEMEHEKPSFLLETLFLNLCYSKMNPCLNTAIRQRDYSDATFPVMIEKLNRTPRAGNEDEKLSTSLREAFLSV